LRKTSRDTNTARDSSSTTWHGLSRGRANIEETASVRPELIVERNDPTCFAEIVAAVKQSEVASSRAGCHSVPNPLTPPANVHHGQAAQVISQRQAVLDAAYQRHREPFVQKPPQHPSLRDAVWINPPASGKENTP
jgi:hypothetical protein